MDKKRPDYIKTLRRARNAKGYTQEYVANVLGLSQAGYRKIESGEVKLKLETALQLGKLLETDITELMTADEERLNVQNNHDNGHGNLHCIIHQQEGEVTALREVIKAKDELIAELRRRLGE